MAAAKEHRLKTVISLSPLINSSLDPLEVRRQAVAAATTLLDAEAGSLFLLDEENGELYFEIALGDKGEAIKDLRLKKGEGIAGWVVDNGVPLLVSDARNDSRFCHQFDEQSSFITRNLVCVPVTIKGTVIGALEAVNKRAGRFTANDMEILGSLAQQVAIALENARLYEENSRNLSAMIAQERRHRVEKERLVKDLHDGIGGIATNISLLAEISLRGDTPGMEKGLSTIAELSRELITELRTFMNTLESSELTWRDLAAEIRSHGTSMLSLHAIRFNFEAGMAEPDEAIGIFLYLSLLRIAKEALANVVKHSGADVVDLSFNVSSECCRMEIRDNGCGVVMKRKEGRGLRNMRSRGADLNARLEIVSSPGTRICLEVPLPFNYPVSPEGER